MDNEVIVEGKSVDDAVEEFLNSRGLKRSEIDYEVLGEGTPGLFGLIGSRKASVKIRIKGDNLDKVREILSGMLKHMGIADAELEVVEEEERVHVRIHSEDGAVIIGKRGKTLNAIQFLLNTILGGKQGIVKKVVLDVGDYRARREESLKKLAGNVSRQVAKTGKAVKLEPMPPAERRKLHIYLDSHKGVTSKSVGRGHQRRIMVTPRRRTEPSRH